MRNFPHLLFLWLWFLPMPGVCQNLTFSSVRGFYETAFQLTLSTDISGGTIRYTTDGTAPTTTSGSMYADQIPITATTVIRAIAYNSGGTVSAVVTHSYLFLEDVIHQPANIPGWPNRTYSLGSGNATAIHDYEMDPGVVNDAAYSGIIKQGLTSIPTIHVYCAE